jgi:hypothetical protein
MIHGCFLGTCGQFADLLSASMIGLDPLEWGGLAKWQFRFAVSATP